MNANYLIKTVEEFCRKNKLDISEIYSKLAKTYQEQWGINIDKQMRDNGKSDMAFYLEEVGIIDRYIHIINRFKKCVENGWAY